MKFFVFDDPKLNIGERNRVTTYYTQELIKHLIKKNGHQIVDPRDADYILLSVTGLNEFVKLRKARRLFPDKKIVAGGSVTFSNPLPLLAFADYVNVGHGFEFFELIGKESIDELPFVISKKSKLDEIQVSNKVKWELVPVIQLSDKTFAYWKAVGCEQKCAFCEVSWGNRYEENPISEKIIQKLIPKRGFLNLIANEYKGMNVDAHQAANATIYGYLKRPWLYEKLNKIRFGIEGATEETRSFLLKPIKDADIKKCILHICGQNKTILMFIILGFDREEDWFEFGERVGFNEVDYRGFIEIIPNYFIAPPNTPLEWIDLRELKDVNLKRIGYRMIRMAGRIRVYGMEAYFSRADYFSILGRTDFERVHRVLKLKPKRDRAQFLDEAYALGLDKEIEGDALLPKMLGPNFEKKERLKEMLKRKWMEKRGRVEKIEAES